MYKYRETPLTFERWKFMHAVKRGPIKLANIPGLPKERMDELNRFLFEIWGMPLLTPMAPPKENWRVFHDEDPVKALESARLALNYAAGGSSLENLSRPYRNAFNEATNAAHFAEPARIRSEATRNAQYFARMEGEYFARSAGEAVSRLVGSNTELMGMVISTADLKYPNGGKEDAANEAAERISALRMGYVVVGSVDGIYYLICIGTPPSWQFLEDGRSALRRLSINDRGIRT